MIHWDMLSRWTRQAPLQALAVAFLVGVLFSRRRRLTRHSRQRNI
jgi:hypothetical protein